MKQKYLKQHKGNIIKYIKVILNTLFNVVRLSLTYVGDSQNWSGGAG